MVRSFFLVAIATSAMAVSLAVASEGQQTDYEAVVASINNTMCAHHYDPSELESPDYKRVKSAVEALAATVTTDEAFINGFREVWKDAPFSHVELRAAQQSADELAAYLDTLRVGGGGAVLTWSENIAILTVNTMMGLDTIEEIEAAYATIAGRQTDALIIDLRENGGGAFAIRPLAAHLLVAPVDAGSFVSQQWNRNHDRAPSQEELQAVEPWDGWSIRAFWADVQDQALVRLSISPAESVFEGPVYVLTSKQTASAAELAVDILKGSGRATVIGENTAGQMLSQKIYDVAGGFHLSLPIADYYSVASGRIEGVGIAPDIESDAADALNVALQLLRDL